MKIDEKNLALKAIHTLLTAEKTDLSVRRSQYNAITMSFQCKGLMSS